MSTSENPVPPGTPPPGVAAPAWEGAAPPPTGYGRPMPPVAGDQFARPTGPVGRIRSTGLVVLLFFVTLGIWSFVYYYRSTTR